MLARKPKTLADCTTEQLEQLDFLRCSLDFDYWLSHYGWMKDEQTGQGIGPGVTQWPAQRDYTRRYLAGEWLIVGKARQVGVSWLATNCDVYQNLFLDNVGLGIVDKRDEDAMFHLDRHRWVYDRQPPHLRRHALPVVGKDNKHLLGLSNGSSISSYPCSEGAARGPGRKRIRCEEFAFWEGEPAKVLAALKGATRDHGQLVIISTGNGMGGAFAEEWRMAESGQSPFRPVFIPWHARPDRPADFRDGMTALERQEWPEQPSEMFLRSGQPFFDIDVLAWLSGQFEAEPLRTEFGECLKVWRDPEPGHLYIIGADTADGGGDACYASIRDRETREQVASYQSYTDEAGQFGSLCVDLAERYNGAWLGIERNNMGVAAVDRAIQRGYRNLYHHQEYDPASQTMNPKAGWKTSSTSRPLMLDYLRGALREYPVPQIHDPVFYRQAEQYGHYGGRPDHPPGGNDDAIIAEAIVEQLCQQASQSNKQEEPLIVYRNGQPVRAD